MDISSIILILSIIIGIASAIFSISTIIRTRNKYYQEFLSRKKQTETFTIEIKQSKKIVNKKEER